MQPNRNRSMTPAGVLVLFLSGVFLIALLVLATSCSDADRASLSSWGKPARITLWSGGPPAKVWTSTGKVSSIENSDGWQFKDSETGQFVRVGGAVSVETIEEDDQ